MPWDTGGPKGTQRRTKRSPGLITTEPSGPASRGPGGSQLHDFASEAATRTRWIASRPTMVRLIVGPNEVGQTTAMHTFNISPKCL